MFSLSLIEAAQLRQHDPSTSEIADLSSSTGASAMAVSISLARAGGAGGSQSAVRERTARRWAQLLRERLGTADGAAQLLRGRLGIADGGGAAPQRFVVSRMERTCTRHERYPPARTTAVAVPLVRRFSLAPRAAAGLRLIRPLGLRQTAQPRCELTPQPPTSACVRRRLPREPGAAGVHRRLAQLSLKTKSSYTLCRLHRATCLAALRDYYTRHKARAITTCPECKVAEGRHTPFWSEGRRQALSRCLRPLP